MSSSTKLKSDVDQLDDLVKDLLDEVNRPIGNNNIHRYSYQRHSNNDLSNSKLPSSSALNTSQRHDFDISSNNTQRSKPHREERIRIKRGTGSTEIPITTTRTSSSITRTTKPEISSTIDEHLIDSLLESVQNTLRKREQRYQSNSTTDVPIHNRRTYSSSAAYPDSVRRVG